MSINRPIILIISALAFLKSLGHELPDYELRPASESPEADYGSIERYTVRSRSLNADITVDVWLPQSYDTSEDMRHHGPKNHRTLPS